MAFKKADKKQTYLRMALLGPSGSGKSYTALRIAHALAQGGPIAAFDTERGSLSKYAGDPNPDGGIFEFDVQDDMQDFAVQKYISAIQEAEKACYKVMVIDSLSHAWAGTGGILEFVDAKKGNSSNGFAAWRDATPLHNRLVDTILTAKMHIIVTMRTKMDYVQEKDEKGRTSIRKVGMQPVQREGLEYEFDVIADLGDPSETTPILTVSKTRCTALRGAAVRSPGKELATQLLSWLSVGAAPKPEVAPSPEEEAAQHQKTAILIGDLIEEKLQRARPEDEACLQIASRYQQMAANKQMPADWASLQERLKNYSVSDLGIILGRVSSATRPAPVS